MATYVPAHPLAGPLPALVTTPEAGAWIGVPTGAEKSIPVWYRAQGPTWPNRAAMVYPPVSGRQALPPPAASFVWATLLAARLPALPPFADRLAAMSTACFWAAFEASFSDFSLAWKALS